MLIIYIVLAWLLIPIGYELVNREVQDISSPTSHALVTKVVNRVKGFPAWVINVILCVVVAIVVIFLPGVELKFGVQTVFLVTSAIYIGNAMIFNAIIKPFFQSRFGSR